MHNTLQQPYTVSFGAICRSKFVSNLKATRTPGVLNLGACQFLELCLQREALITHLAGTMATPIKVMSLHKECPNYIENCVLAVIGLASKGSLLP